MHERFGTGQYFLLIKCMNSSLTFRTGDLANLRTCFSVAVPQSAVQHSTAQQGPLVWELGLEMLNTAWSLISFFLALLTSFWTRKVMEWAFIIAQSHSEACGAVEGEIIDVCAKTS